MMTTQPRHDRVESIEPRPDSARRRTRGIAATITVLAVGAVVAVMVALAADDESSSDAQSADVAGQGNSEPVLATDAAELERRQDGLLATMDIATPEPGSYEYPTGDMVSPWADPHPVVSPGATKAPEVFTLWLIAFNEPESCTDGECDVDDLAADALARGGVYQLDGRIAEGPSMSFVGNIRVGQHPDTGSPLDDPIGAEVHLAIAPHGRVLSGTDGWRQLNGPVGNPALWWTAEFSPTE